MTRITILLLAALGLGIAAAFGTIYVQERNSERILAQYEQVLVLVAIEDVPPGTTLEDAKKLKLIEFELFPQEFLPRAALLESGNFEASSAATHLIEKGALILDGDFVPASELPAQQAIQTGHVAVSLLLSGQQRSAGLILPGTYVGILETTYSSASDLNQTRVLFEKVRVLAIDGEAGDGRLLSAGSATNDATVTLEVPENSVGQLIESYSNGDITLVLLAEGKNLPINQKGK